MKGKESNKKIKGANSGKNSSSEPKVGLKKNFDFRTVALFGFIFSLLLLIFCYHFFGSFFEMNDDPRYVMAMKGFASPLPYNNFVSAYLFTSDLYIFLYHHFPEIGWYGYTMFFMLWGALFNVFISLYLFSYKRTNPVFILLIFLAFVFLVFLQNIYWINFTRPSILATASFIILLAGLYLNEDVFRRNKWIVIFPALAYLFAHLTRLDAGHLGFLSGLVTSILIIFQKKELIPFLLKYITPIVVFIVLIYFYDGFTRKQNTRNKDFLEKTELIRQLIDYRNSAAYVPKDKKDTLAYNAMLNARYCSDNKVITADFIRSLTDSSPLLERVNVKKFDDESGAFLKSLDGENNVIKMLLISFLIIIFFWFLSAPGKNLIGFLKFIFLQLFFISIVLYMCYFMKMPARVFHPLLTILTFSNLLLLFSVVSFEKKKYSLIFYLPVVFCFFSFSAYSKANKELISSYKKYGKINHSIVNDMNAQFNETVFIPTNLRSWEFHDATDPIHEINFKNKNSYVYLSIELSLAPETQDQLMDKFKTSDHDKLFQKISAMNNVIFLSDDNYNRFLRSYYHFIYNQDYYFEKATAEDPSFYSSTGLNYYRLKKIQ